ncbi:MAG TPA: two-component system response regulator, partial [Anaerolineales bacterium]|nr:two-component system response regulator [Anaerolineales bacterium]
PFGLKGEQIPYSPRLFAIIDVWDAIPSNRPYRKAWSFEKALEYIKSESGRHFDPNIVELFLRMVNGFRNE